MCSFESSGTDAAANQGPPTLVWRVFAALCYLVPWIDSISFGREIYRRFRNLLVLYLVPGPLAKVYFSSQFAPLIIFFVLFLAVVKNKKLHHFVRFNCMQAIMLDIVIMLCHIVKAYLPAEIKWSVIAHLVDMGMWTTCMGTVVYAVFWTLRGYYADIPFVSESVYHQVALSEYARVFGCFDHVDVHTVIEIHLTPSQMRTESWGALLGTRVCVAPPPTLTPTGRHSMRH